MNHVMEALLKALKVLPSAIAALPQIAELVQEVGMLGGSRDQLTLQLELKRIIAENKEGFDRLDAKLVPDADSDTVG